MNPHKPASPPIRQFLPLPVIWYVLVVHHFRFRRTDVVNIHSQGLAPTSTLLTFPSCIFSEKRPHSTIFKDFQSYSIVSDRFRSPACVSSHKTCLCTIFIRFPPFSTLSARFRLSPTILILSQPLHTSQLSTGHKLGWSATRYGTKHALGASTHF
jgi:hypothetical protein